jgi:hypothetical protein
MARVLHPGLMPDCIRASTHGVDIQSRTGLTLPYWPTISQWPDLSFNWSPLDRRADVATTTIQFMPSADIPVGQLGSSGTPMGYARVDLWTDGVMFEDMIPLIQGPVTESSFNDADDIISLTIADGDILKSVEFPPSSFKIDRDEFPNSPDYIAGYAPRSIILGPFPNQVPCYQIDQFKREFYICEPALSSGPTKVYIGGDDIQVLGIPFPRHEVGVLSNYQTYSKLVFQDPIDSVNAIGFITCSGGVGTNSQHPVNTLLKYGDYLLSPDATAHINTLPFNFFVLANNSGSVYDLVTSRILPQTDLIGTLHLDHYHTIKLLGTMPEIRMGIGNGLVFRYVDHDVETDHSKIFNAIEVRYQRDIFSKTTPFRTAFMTDSTHGAFTAQNVCRRSEQLYGRRYEQIQCPDIVQYLDHTFQGHPVNIVDLANKIAQTNSLPHNEFVYQTNWLEGLSIWLNYRILLTDPDLGFVDRPTRVVSLSIPSTGPQITLQTELT